MGRKGKGSRINKSKETKERTCVCDATFLCNEFVVASLAEVHQQGDHKTSQQAEKRMQTISN